MDFVEEVEERLRAERYAGLARRYLPWLVLAVAATIVGWLGVWAYDSWRDHQIGRASVAYDKALTELAAGDRAGAYNAFAPTAASGPPAYRALALLQQADIRFGAGRSVEAITLYDAAAKAAPNAILGDLARLRAAQVLMDSAPYAQVETRLKALMGDGRPYSLEAKEMLAMAKLQAGKAQEARGDFNALGLTLGVTPGMRARAQGAVALIDSGQAALVGEVVRNAATLPPSSGAMSPGSAGAPPAPDSAQNPAGNPQ